MGGRISSLSRLARTHSISPARRPPGDLARSAARILMKCFYGARFAIWDILTVTTKLATMIAIKKILIDSSSETLGSGAGTLRSLMSTLSKSQCYEWQLVSDVEENWTQLLTIFPQGEE